MISGNTVDQIAKNVISAFSKKEISEKLNQNTKKAKKSQKTGGKKRRLNKMKP